MECMDFSPGGSSFTRGRVVDWGRDGIGGGWWVVVDVGREVPEELKEGTNSLVTWY